MTLDPDPLHVDEVTYGQIIGMMKGGVTGDRPGVKTWTYTPDDEEPWPCPSCYGPPDRCLDCPPLAKERSGMILVYALAAVLVVSLFVVALMTRAR